MFNVHLPVFESNVLPDSTRYCFPIVAVFSMVGTGFMKSPDMPHTAVKEAVTKIAPLLPNLLSISSTNGAIMTVPNPVPHLKLLF